VVIRRRGFKPFNLSDGGQILPAPDEIGKSEGGRKVGDRDQEIGNDVELYQSWVPEIAVAMRMKPLSLKNSGEALSTKVCC